MFWRSGSLSAFSHLGLLRSRIFVKREWLLVLLFFLNLSVGG